MSDATAGPTADPTASYSCRYCRTTTSGAESTCPSCGAPVDVARRTTSGWVELPAIPDMTRVQLGHSTVQIMGTLVPAADVRLAAGEGVFFPRHNLLWQEPSVDVRSMPLRGAWNRMRAGLPVVMLEAGGPGTISFSHDTAGEMIAIPLTPGAAVDVREHQLVAGTLGIDFQWFETGIWFRTSGDGGVTQTGGAGLLKLGLDAVGIESGGDERRADDNEWHYPLGQYMDRFVAGDQPGAVLIQVGGTAFLRDLAEGESILVKPPALLYKDPTVAMEMHVEFPSAGMRFWRSWGNRYLWLRLHGPGRVALQSSYDRLEDPGSDFRDSCRFTQRAW